MPRLASFLVVLLVLAAGVYYAFYRGNHTHTPVINEPVAGGMVKFSSDHIGLSLSYPDTYVATTTHQGDGESEWHTLILMDAVAAANAPQGGEGPPAITVQDIPNPKGLSIEAWIKSDQRSNWQLAEQNGGLGSTTVGGKPAMAYRHSGLYETSAVAVAHNGKIYLFAAGWLTAEDQIRKDFEKLLETVQFI